MCVELLTPDGNWSLPAAPPRRRGRLPVKRGDLLLPGREGEDGSSPSTAPTRATARSTSTSLSATAMPSDPPRLSRPVCRRARLPAVLPECARRPGRRAHDGVLRRPHAPLGPRRMETSARPAGPHDHRRADPMRRLGIAVIGFGWMGRPTAARTDASRCSSDRIAEPDLVVCADPDPARAELATASFGFEKSTPIGNWPSSYRTSTPS